MTQASLAQKLNLNSIVDRIVLAVSANEGNFTSINHNDAGYGWSVGIRQWNQKAGELPDLLQSMFAADPVKFKELFGQWADKLIDVRTGRLNEQWARQTDFEAIVGFDKRLIAALDYFQDLQVELAREFVRKAIALAREYGFQTELGWAEVADIVNQKGYNGCTRCLRTIGGAGNDEAKAIEALETTAGRPHGQSRLDSLRRRFSPTVVASLSL